MVNYIYLCDMFHTLYTLSCFQKLFVLLDIHQVANFSTIIDLQFSDPSLSHGVLIDQSSILYQLFIALYYSTSCRRIQLASRFYTFDGPKRSALYYFVSFGRQFYISSVSKSISRILGDSYKGWSVTLRYSIFTLHYINTVVNTTYPHHHCEEQSTRGPQYIVR